MASNQISFAQDAEKPLTSQQKAIVAALKSAGQAATKGPANVTLIDQGTLSLPEGYLFIPKKEAADFMHTIGNETGPQFIGLILSRNDKLRWFIEVDFIKSGYVKDDDAKKWNADDLLKNIKEDTMAANEERVAKGFRALDVLGWVEPPAYDSSSHQLVWSMLAQDRGASLDNQIVNYNTYALGRDGFFKLTLITPKASIAQDKLHSRKMLAALTYNKGKRYQDFAERSDKVAEFGLAALVAGVVAKKVGLLALAGVFLAKIAKIAIIACVVFMKKIKKFFKRDKFIPADASATILVPVSVDEKKE